MRSSGRFSMLSSVQSLSHVRLFATPWTVAHRASPSITNSQSPPKPMSIESVMPSNHLILCCPLLLLPSIPPSIRVFSNESALHMRWPKYWSFSFSISPSIEHPGLISFRMDWLDLLAVQGTLKSLLQHHSDKKLNPWRRRSPARGAGRVFTRETTHRCTKLPSPASHVLRARACCGCSRVASTAVGRDSTHLASSRSGRQSLTSRCPGALGAIPFPGRKDRLVERTYQDLRGRGAQVSALLRNPSGASTPAGAAAEASAQLCVHRAADLSPSEDAAHHPETLFPWPPRAPSRGLPPAAPLVLPSDHHTSPWGCLHFRPPGLIPPVVRDFSACMFT